MTFAWYGHLKLQETGVSRNWPLIAVILFSWAVALFEYMCQVPANRIGFIENGGPFTLMQLKVVQEVISLIVFTVIVTLMFKGEGFPLEPFSGIRLFDSSRLFCFCKIDNLVIL